MILRYEKWQEIRNGFTEEDKEVILRAITGETICPRGWVIDVNNLPPDIASRLFDKKTSYSK